MANSDRPKVNDAILGGQFPPPASGAVLGGIEGVERCLQDRSLEVRLRAITRVLEYGEVGIDLALARLLVAKGSERIAIYQLLAPRKEPKIVTMLQQCRVWNLPERFHLPHIKSSVIKHSSIFANRPVKTFNPQEPISNPRSFTWALRYSSYNNRNYLQLWEKLLSDPCIGELEALIIGDILFPDTSLSSRIVDKLVEENCAFAELKYIFIGDITGEESEISWIEQTNMSPLLNAYPELKILQTRGGK